MNAIGTDDGRCETQENTEFLEVHRHGTSRALQDRIGVLATGQKHRFGAVLRDQIRLRQALKQSACLERFDHDTDVFAGIEGQHVEEVAEYQAFVGVEVRRRKLLGRETTDKVVVAEDVGKERRTQLLQRRPTHLGETHPKHDLLCRDPFLLPQQVDDVLRVLDVPHDHGRRLFDDVLAGHGAGDHDVGAVGRDRDRLAGKQLRQMLLQGIEVPPHDDVMARNPAGVAPDQQRNGPRGLAVDQHLVWRRHQGVSDIWRRQRDAPNRAVGGQHGRASHQQVDLLMDRRDDAGRHTGDRRRLCSGRRDHDEDQSGRQAELAQPACGRPSGPDALM